MSEKKKEERKDTCPLLAKDWVPILSAEIQHVEMVDLMNVSLFLMEITLLPTLIALLIATVVIGNLFNVSHFIIVVIIIGLIVIIMTIGSFMLYRQVNLKATKPTLENLEKLLKEVISGEINDSNKIYERWKIIERNYKKKLRNVTNFNTTKSS